jgi:hypothetical protein
VLGLVVGILVVGPWAHGGYLLLLDWVSGPNQTLNAGVYGLSAGSIDAMPFRIGIESVRAVVGSAATAWIVVLAYFPLAAAGASMLAGGGRIRRNAAALFMVCNPFVVDRVRAGHVALLLGIALLPWLLRSAVNARLGLRWIAVRPAGWFALAMAVSPHMFWIGGVLLASVALLPKPSPRDLVRTIQIGLSGMLVYFYAVVVYLAGVRTIEVTDADLTAYATVPGPGGLITTLLGLGGFWRDFPDRAATSLPAAVAIPALIATVGLAFLGLVRLWGRAPELGRPLAMVSALGLVLASGVSGPFELLYRGLFDALPFFEAMREQQKWLALTMLGFAVGMGAAAEWVSLVVPDLVHRLRNTTRHRVEGAISRSDIGAGAAAGLTVGALALASAPALFWGLGGTVQASSYPAGWYETDQRMGTGDELALFLPWHGYQPFAFTDGRSVATPAGAFFRRPVLASDSVELAAVRTNSVSLRNAYLDRIIASGGGGTAFGRLVAPLGVRYIVLAKDRAWDGYQWVGRQRDLRLVLSSDSVDLYQVIPTGTGRVVAQRSVPDLERATRMASADELGTEALVTDGGDDGNLPSSRAGGLRRLSETAWEVSAGTPGWTVIPEEWSAGWRAADGSGQPTLAGSVAFRLGGESMTIDYRPWRWLRIGTAVSLAALLALLVLGLVEHRHEVRRALLRRHGRSLSEDADRAGEL